MDGPELSAQERTILNGIEGDLRADARLDRRLRTMQRGLRPWTGSRGSARAHRLGLCTSLLALICAVLFVRAAATASAAALWLFAALWVPTATGLLLMACRRGRSGPR